MALTVQQSKAVNDLLGWLLRDRAQDPTDPHEWASRERVAMIGAALLAEAAHDRLQAGVDAKQVFDDWSGRVR